MTLKYAWCLLFCFCPWPLRADDLPIVELDAKALRQNLIAVFRAWTDTEPVKAHPLAGAIIKNDPIEVQKAVDQHVALLITINPESRVKVELGPAKVHLRMGWQNPVLVKIINEGGITATLQVKIKEAGSITTHFYEYQSFAEGKPALTRKLSGVAAEYKALMMRSTAVGKQEVTLCFDAGQATQDLAFRAEVPLFTETVLGSEPFNLDKFNLLTFTDREGKVSSIKHSFEWKLGPESRILNSFHQVAGFRPLLPLNDPNPMVRIDEERVLTHVTLRKIRYLVDKDDWVPAYLLIPRNHPEKLPAVLCLHQTTKIGKAEPAGLGGLPNLHYALELAERGYVTLAPDYPGYGDYTECNPYRLGYDSATMKGVTNHSRAVTLLSKMPEVDPERIGCIGHSLGGHNTLFVGLFDNRIKVLATSCGFCSFPKYYGGDLKGWSHKGYMPRIASLYQCDPKQMPFDFTEILAAMAPRPVFINAPLKDVNFNVDGVRDCVKAAMPVYKLFGKPEHLVVEHPDCGHDFPPDVRQRCYAFFDKYLKAAATVK